MTKFEIESQYNEVGSVLRESLSEARSINLSGDEEKGELADIISRLENINAGFQEEIEALRSSSEWDKFCIAFFGETNAGKSTIIESLRIIYDDESRRIEMLKQKKDCEALLTRHCDNYEALVKALAEVNLALSENKKKQSVMRIVCYIGFTVLGFLIAVVLSILGLI